MAGSYASGTSTVPLLGETIGDNLRRTVSRFGDREALVDRGSGRRFTYTELLDAVEALAGGLVEAGVRKGDRVGIWAPNRWEWVILQYATADMGAILVNINPAYRRTSWNTCSTRPASRCWWPRRRSRPATTGPWSTR